jgi:hypothetical protein
VVGDEKIAPSGLTEAWRALDVSLAPVLAARVAPRSLTLLCRDFDGHVVTVALLV